MINTLHSSEINLLRVFVTVCECRGVTPAAEKLGVSPSTVSTQLLDLEERLKIKLCQRGRQGFRMTAEGIEVLNSAYKVFKQVEDFVFDVNSLKGEIVGRLKVGIIDNTCSHPQLKLDRVIKSFQKSYPKVELVFNVCAPDVLEESILNREFDLGIGVRGKRLPNLTYKRLCDELSVVCCGKSHPLFKADYSSLNSKLLSKSNWVYDFYRFPDKIPEINEPYLRTYVTNIEASLYLVLAGSHLSSLPKHYIQPFVDRGEIKIILENQFSYSLEFTIISNRNRKQEKLISLFTKLLLRHVG